MNYIANDKWNMYKSEPDIIAAIASLDSTLSITTDAIKLLNSTIGAISLRVNSSSSSVYANKQTTKGNTYPIEAIPSNYFGSVANREEKSTVSPGNLGIGKGEIMKSVAAVSEWADVLEGVASFGSEIFPTLQRFEKPLKAIGNMSKVAGGTSGVMSGIFGELGAAEGLLAGGELLGGAAAITEVLSGPVGWTILLGSIALGTWDYMNEQEKERKRSSVQKKYNPDDPVHTFRMSSKEADKYIDAIPKIVKSVKVMAPASDKPWQLKADIAKDVRKRYGNDAFDPVHYAPTATNDMPSYQHFSPNLWAANKEQLPVKQTYTQQTTPIVTKLINAGYAGGKEGFELAIMKESIAAQQHDLVHKTGKTEQLTYAGKQALSFLQMGENYGKKDPTMVALPPSKKAQYGSSKPNGRTVTINLNRPMIEHFSIHTGTTKEGINELRNKVEGVLLEILNSANVI